MGRFTEQLVKDVKNGIDKITDVLDSEDELPAEIVNHLGEVRFVTELRLDITLLQEATKLGQQFLAVEKYVNLNYMVVQCA